MNKKVIDHLPKLNPEKLVYISCDPSALARDTDIFTGREFEIEKVVSLYMFLHTYHMERVVLLSHKNADTNININVEFGEGGGKIPVGKIAEIAGGK